MSRSFESADRYEKFCFLAPGELRDGELRLVLERCDPADPGRGWVPCYRFEMRLDRSDGKAGNIDFRAGWTKDLVMYGGHFAYGVNPECRGNRLAERSARLLIPFVKQHGFGELWITCNPDNWPSRRTCERLGAELIEIVELPEHSDMYRRGERRKCRFCLKLG